MGKNRKKARPEKKNKYMRTCERCGNEMFSMSRSFICNFCGWVNKFKHDGSSQQERKVKSYEHKTKAEEKR